MNADGSGQARLTNDFAHGMLEVTFDEHFPAETFVLSVPEETPRRPTRGAAPREVTIEEAADLAELFRMVPRSECVVLWKDN